MVAATCNRAYRNDDREDRQADGDPTIDNMVGSLLAAEDQHNHRELVRLVAGFYGGG